MESSDFCRRRIGQIARHLRGSFGILNQACSGARKDGRVFFSRQASENYGQFMRPFQSKQVSNGEKNEGYGAMQLPAVDPGAIEQKWSPSSGKDTKFKAGINSAPIFAKAEPVSGTSAPITEPVEKLTSFQSSGKKARLPTSRSYQDISSGLENTTSVRKPTSATDVDNGVDGAGKSPVSTAERQNSERLGFEWFPRMDVVESGTAYVITVELPGVSADGIQVEVVRGSLIVTGSRATDWWKSNGNGVNGGGTVYHRRELAQGPYRTVWRLPKNVDINGVTAEFIDGFLRILVPKRTLLLGYEVGDQELIMDGARVERAREALNLSHAMASLTNTGLDRQTVSILIGLCEHGVNPEALATVVKELRREAAAMASKSKTIE